MIYTCDSRESGRGLPHSKTLSRIQKPTGNRGNVNFEVMHRHFSID